MYMRMCVATLHLYEAQTYLHTHVPSAPAPACCKHVCMYISHLGNYSWCIDMPPIHRHTYTCGQGQSRRVLPHLTV